MGRWLSVDNGGAFPENAFGRVNSAREVGQHIVCSRPFRVEGDPEDGSPDN